MRPGSTGVVVAIGDCAVQAARFVSQLRSWRVAQCTDLDDACHVLAESSVRHAVMVMDNTSAPPHAYAGFASKVAQRLPDLSVGFLYGRTEPELCASARRLSAVPRAMGPRVRQAAFAYPEFAGCIAGTRATKEAAAMDSQSAAHVIAGPMDVMYLVGHSGGHDAGVEGVALCRRPTASADSEESRAYPCYHGAECRFVTAGFRVLSSDRLRATVVVALTCWGVSVFDVPFDRSLSVGEGILQYSAVEALLTTVRAANVTRTDFLAFYYLILAGLPLGTVVNKVNRIRVDDGEEPEFFCFGDPAIALDSAIDIVAPRVNGTGAEVSLPPFPAMRDIRVPISVTPRFGFRSNPREAVTASLATDTDLYLTIAPAPEPVTLAFPPISQDDGERPDVPVMALRQDLGYLDRLLRGLGARIQPKFPDSLVSLKYSVAVLQELLDTWRDSRHSRSDVAFTGADSRDERLYDSLVRVGSSLADLCAEIGHVGDRFLMSSPFRYYERQNASPDHPACPYCGNRVTEENYRAISQPENRVFASCEACGPLYEGIPKLVEPIRFNSPLAIASDNLVSVSVASPYEIPVPAVGVFALMGYRLKPEVVMRSPIESLAPGSIVDLKCVIHCHEQFVPGVYYLGATVVAGLAVSHLKCPVTVRRQSSR